MWLLIFIFMVVQSALRNRQTPEQQRKETTQIILNQVGIMLDYFKKTCGDYPTTKQGLDALKVKPADLNCPTYEPIRQDYILKDAWSHPLRYTSDGKHYRLEASHGLSKESS